MTNTTKRIIGQRIERLEQVGSTNDLVREQAKSGASEGVVITAEEQTAGRGRLGREWHAPPGSSLLLSVLLRPHWLPADATYTLTMLAAVALCRAVEATEPGLHALLKWPNDLLLPAAPTPNAPLLKAAGILSEVVFRGEAIDYVILGMGVNVNWSPRGMVDGRDLGTLATSVARAVGHAIDRETVLQHLLAQLDAHYAMLRRGQREAIFTAWRARLHTLGQQITLTTANTTLHGIAEDVNPHGALLLRAANGLLHTVTAGDVGA